MDNSINKKKGLSEKIEEIVLWLVSIAGLLMMLLYWK